MNKLPNDVREKLRAPLPPDAIKPHPTKSFLSTIKAIYVTERFNDVFGLNGWSVKTDVIHWARETKKNKKGEEYQEYTVMSKTTISFPEYGIVHECIAGSSNEDLGDAAKGATTDAITKIGSYLEVGIDVFKGLKSPTKPAAKPAAKKAAPPPPTNGELPELTPKDKYWEAIKKRIKDGVTVETIKQFYRISEENAKLLTA